jgi:hypothetical protein
MRYAIWLLPLVLAACATPGADKGIEIETTHAGKAITDAQCTVTTDAGSWQVTTPGTAPVGTPSGDLRVVCDKAGYRTSEVVYRATPGTSNMSIGIGGGTGGRVGVGFGFGIPIGQGRTTYPSRIVVDMNPQ